MSTIRFSLMVLRGYWLKRPFGPASPRPVTLARVPPRPAPRLAPRLLRLATVRARAVIKGEVIKINRLLESNLIRSAKSCGEPRDAGAGTCGVTSASEAVKPRFIS